MHKITLKKVLIFTGILFSSSCDDQVPAGPQINENTRSEEVLVKPEIISQLPDTGIIPEPVMVTSRPRRQVIQVSKEVEISNAQALEEELAKEGVVLDLSLYLEIDDQYSDLPLNKISLLQGVFKLERLNPSNLGLEAHFARPHIENEERAITPDGAGVKLNIGF